MKFPADKCECGLDLRDVEPVNVEEVLGEFVIGECPNCGRTYTLTEAEPVLVVVKETVTVLPEPVQEPVQEPKAEAEEETDFEWKYEFVKVPKPKPTPTKKGKK